MKKFTAVKLLVCGSIKVSGLVYAPVPFTNFEVEESLFVFSLV